MSLRDFARDPLVSIANHKWALAITYAMTVLTGAVGFGTIEHHTPIESLYFAVVAGTSTGFGDLAPKTEPGMLFVTLYLLWAIPVLLSLVTAFILDKLRKDPNMFTDDEQQELLKMTRALYRAHGLEIDRDRPVEYDDGMMVKNTPRTYSCHVTL